MIFESIQLINYRCHRNLKVEFRPGFNVIVGVNGSGKTSILKAICDSMTGFANYMSINYGGYQALAEPGVATLRTEASNGRYRFEPQYPVKVAASAEAFGIPCAWNVSKKSQVDHPDTTGTPPGQLWQQEVNRHPSPGEFSGQNTILPLIAFYRANRNWNATQPNEMSAATQKVSRNDGFRSWWDASLDTSALQVWVIGKCLERFQTSSETSVSFDDIHDDELALVNAALALAVEGAKGLRYDLKQKSLLVEWHSENEVQRDPTGFENLSDGQRAVIGLVADIARRMCLLNPQLSHEVTEQTPGVVLIDELDMHLHPRWQRILTAGLKRAFPAIQFIVASHSPQVLGELHPDEIILLRPEGTMHPQVSYGLSSSQILEEIMGADARTSVIEKSLSALFEALERNELDPARTQLEALKLAAPGIPELAGAEALLKRKEVLGR